MKILIIRFSSIGDIVWTTPVIRCIKEQLNCELHFCTKKQYRFLVEQNPHLDKVHYLEDSLGRLIGDLQKENFDYVIDLHNKIRSIIIRTILGKKWFTYKKLNFLRFLLTRFQWDLMPAGDHIVKRYLEAVEKIGVIDDGKGIEYQIKPEDEMKPEEFPLNYVAFVIGASKFNKKLPVYKWVELSQQVQSPIVLVGGKEDHEQAEELLTSPMLKDKIIINACGKYNLSQSASIVKNAFYVVGHDTGLTHIAAAFHKKIYSIWGSTSPIGYEPYLADNIIIENKHLDCRPCSKSGLDHCPKKHFKCMNDLDFNKIPFHP